MSTEDELIEEEANQLFNCPKGPSNYLVGSSGSIGPSKLVKTKS